MHWRHRLPLDLRLHQPPQQHQRLLRGQVTALHRHHGGDALLHHGHLGAAGHRFQRNGGRHFARQVGVVEAAGVADAFVLHQLQVLAAEGHAVAGGEVGTRHAPATAELGVRVAVFAGDAVRRQLLSAGGEIAAYDATGHPAPTQVTTMTMDEYNNAVKQILAEQQTIATATAQIAMTGKANPTNPEFSQLMTKQWGLVQQMAKLNTDAMLGIMSPKK